MGREAASFRKRIAISVDKNAREYQSSRIVFPLKWYAG